MRATNWQHIKANAELKTNRQAEKKIIACQGYGSFQFTGAKTTVWKGGFYNKYGPLKIPPRIQDKYGGKGYTGQRDGRNYSSNWDLCAFGLIVSQSPDSWVPSLYQEGIQGKFCLRKNQGEIQIFLVRFWVELSLRLRADPVAANIEGAKEHNNSPKKVFAVGIPGSRAWRADPEAPEGNEGAKQEVNSIFCPKQIWIKNERDGLSQDFRQKIKGSWARLITLKTKQSTKK